MKNNTWMLLLLLFAVPGFAFAGDSDCDDPTGEECEPATGACCFEKEIPGGEFEFRCTPEKTEEWCEERRSFTWSEGLDCDQVSCPPIELGSCCLDCEPESNTGDTCEDEATEAWCDESIGSWLLDTPCSQREDCGDFCSVITGSVCLPQGGCEEMTFDECVGQFSFGFCEEAWGEGLECDETACARNVPVAPGYWFGLLAVALVGTSLWALRKLRRLRPSS